MTDIQDDTRKSVEHLKYDARSWPKSMNESTYLMIHLSGHTKTFLTGKVIICTHTQARLVIFAKYYDDDQIKEDGTCKYIRKRLETNTNFDCKEERPPVSSCAGGGAGKNYKRPEYVPYIFVFLGSIIIC